MSDARPNLPVPDELAAVRDQIKALTEREAELRKSLIKHPDLRTGASWAAEVREVVQERIDLRELCAMYPDIADEYTFKHKQTRVVLKQITEDGELITPKRRSISDE